jgi:transposase InsO family protein
MKLSAHPERRSAFQRLVYDLDLLHGTIQPGCPWQNAMIERSNRTDNEELFDRMRFEDSETRRYQLKLWEYYYNTQRPHQGLGLQRPMDVYLSEYRFHAHTRMLI